MREREAREIPAKSFVGWRIHYSHHFIIFIAKSAFVNLIIILNGIFNTILTTRSIVI